MSFINQLREDIKKIYIENKDDLFRSFGLIQDQSKSERRYYVYEWFTKEEKKVFYVGKGTGRRYNHIITDMKRGRGYDYLLLQNDFGIDYRIVKNELTEQEALIYEIYQIHLRESQGEVLIQFIHAESMWEGYEEEYQKLKQMIVPSIWIDPFYRRYYNVEQGSLFYDQIEDDSFCGVYYRQNWSAIKDPRIISRITNYIISLGGKVYKSKCKSVKTIIDFGVTAYSEYKKYKEHGCTVLNCIQVINYINSIKK